MAGNKRICYYMKQGKTNGVSGGVKYLVYQLCSVVSNNSCHGNGE